MGRIPWGWRLHLAVAGLLILNGAMLLVIAGLDATFDSETGEDPTYVDGFPEGRDGGHPNPGRNRTRTET